MNMELNTGMTHEGRAAISGGLSKLLADSYALYVKTQNFHWNVVAPEFYGLHKLSESQYQEMGEALDEIAERIRALGFYVDATLAGFKKLTSITESSKIHPKYESLLDLIQAQELVIREARALSKLAEEEEDQATVDLCARRLGVHEKALWMLRASI